MSDLKIKSMLLQPTNIKTVQKILASTEVSNSEKISYLKQHSSEINHLIDTHISSQDYSTMMKARPLELFKPIKNSFTKRGDKILLAKALNMTPAEVNNYIKSVSDSLKKVDNLDFLPKDTIDKIKTYVYRHGSLDELISVLGYDLKTARDITKEVYKTLDYNNEGIAKYFIRPIHRMTNNTLIKIYNTIDENLEYCLQSGKINEADKQKTSQWALVTLYKIKENQKLKNAIKTYKAIT